MVFICLKSAVLVADGLCLKSAILMVDSSLFSSTSTVSCMQSNPNCWTVTQLPETNDYNKSLCFVFPVIEF
jgi:hypothetical protein